MAGRWVRPAADGAAQSGYRRRSYMAYSGAPVQLDPPAGPTLQPAGPGDEAATAAAGTTPPAPAAPAAAASDAAVRVERAGDEATRLGAPPGSVALAAQHWPHGTQGVPAPGLDAPGAPIPPGKAQGKGGRHLYGPYGEAGPDEMGRPAEAQGRSRSRSRSASGESPTDRASPVDSPAPAAASAAAGAGNAAGAADT